MQAVYDEAKINLGEHHLTMATETATVTVTVSSTWYMTTKDAFDTGINPFRFGDTDLYFINKQVQVLHFPHDKVFDFLM